MLGNKLLKTRWQYAQHAISLSPSSWVQLIIKWNPQECIDDYAEYQSSRGIGRPRLRWDDDLQNFAQDYFNLDSWLDIPIELMNVSSIIDDYVKYVLD